MLLVLIYLLILAACIGFLYAEGLWSNALRLINVVMAALLAMNFFEPLARWLYGQAPSFTYFLDFLSLWGLFCLFLLIFSTITNLTSRVKVKFLKLADRIGSVFFAAWVGWVMVCFTATTLHTAPLAREPFGGAFVPESRAASSLSPDMLWLGFMQEESSGAFCRLADEREWKEERYVFDKDADFMLRYATRRAKLESHVKSDGALRIRPEDANKHY